jgi:hypothetical protein
LALAGNGRGWTHPDDMLEEMTASEFKSWQAYYEKQPWGPHRDDIRQEVFRRRLIASLFGPTEGQETPGALYPYFEDGPTPEEMFAEIELIDSQLIPNGKGGYEWRQTQQSQS